MWTQDLAARDFGVKLVSPHIERDALLGVHWLEGEPGRDTLRLMGVSDQNNRSSTLEQERARVQDFLNRQDQLNWMIEVYGQVAGAVWVDLEPTGNLGALAVHLMIGDPAMRGKGVGSKVMQLVLGYLHRQGYRTIFSRHLADNKAAAALLAKADFEPSGEVCADADGLRWQNIVEEG